MTRVAFNLTCSQVSANDTSGSTTCYNEVQHLPPRKELHLSLTYLPHQSTVSTQQQLLPRLPSGIKRAGDLSPTKGPIVHIPTIFTSERHALRYTLVDDAVADLRQAVDVCLTGSKVSSLDGIEKEPPYTVVVIGVVLSGIDSPLCRNAVRPSS